MQLCIAGMAACTVMRHRRCSMHGYAQHWLRASPMQGSGGSASRWRVWPLHHTTSTFHQSRALASSSNRPQIQQEYWARQVLQIPSKSGRSSILIPLNTTKASLGWLKTFMVHAGILDSHKWCPQQGLVLPSWSCHIGWRPTSRVVSQGPGVCAQRLDDSGWSADWDTPKPGRNVD
jgi:hypothetical protein